MSTKPSSIKKTGALTSERPPRSSNSQMFILKYIGKSSNLEAWLRNTDIYFIAKYGQAGNFISTLQYVDLPSFDYASALQEAIKTEKEWARHKIAYQHLLAMPEADEDDLGAQVDGEDQGSEPSTVRAGEPLELPPLEDIHITEEMETRIIERAEKSRTKHDELQQKLKEDYRDKRVQCFGDMWRFSDKPIQHAVKSQPSWATLIISRDALTLVKLLIKVGSSPQSIVENRLLIFDITRQYENFYQNSLSVSDYYEESQNKLRQVIANSQPIPEPVDQATRFINGLNRTKFSKLLEELREGTKDMPESLDDAYSMALKHEAALMRNVKVYTSPDFEELAMVVKTKQHKKFKSPSATSTPTSSSAHSTSSTPTTASTSASTPSNTASSGSAPNRDSSEPPAPCKYCGGPHWNKHCPVKPRPGSHLASPAMSHLEEYDEITLSTTGNFIGPHEIGFDTLSSANIVRDDYFASNFRTVQRGVRFVGVGGTVVCKTLCDFLIYGTAWYMPDGPGNILSAAYIKSIGFNWSKDLLVDSINLYTPAGDAILTFDCTFRRLIYTAFCPEASISHLVAAPVLTTVDDALRAFTVAETERMEKVAKILRSLALPSPRKLLIMLRKGKLQGAGIDVADVLNYIKVHGMSSSRERGTSSWQSSSPRPISQEVLERILTPSTIDLAIDLFFPDGNDPYLLSISNPITYIMVTYLRNKSAPTIKAALDTHISKYTAHGFKVVRIFCDGESGVSAVSTLIELTFIQLHQVGHTSHVARIERAIRMVKDTTRSIIADQPFNVPRSLFPWAISFAVSRINMLPNSILGGDVTPRELVTGRQINVPRELSIAFGDLVELPITTTNRVRIARTRPAIALLCTGNANYTWIFWTLDTNSIVRSDRFKPHHHDQLTIDTINRFAANNGIPVPLDAPYFIGSLNRVLPAVDSEEDVPPFLAPDRVVGDHSVVTDPSPAPITASRGAESTINIDGADFNPHELPEQPEDDAVEPDSDTDSMPDLIESDSDSDSESSSESDSKSSSSDSDDDSEDSFDEDSDSPTPPVPAASTDRTNAHRDTSRHTAPIHGHNLRPRASLHLPARFAAATLTPDPTVPALLGGNNGADGEVHHLRSRYGLRFSAPSFLPATEAQLVATNLTVEASIAKFPEAAMEAINTEVQNFIDKQVLLPVKPRGLTSPELQRVLPAKMFIKEVLNPDGSLKKVKARLVAGGHRQRHEDYTASEIYSPTLSPPSLNIIASQATFEQRIVVTVDFPAAYLNAFIKKRIYIRLPANVAPLFIKKLESFNSGLLPTGELLTLLNKAMYGTLEAAELWNEDITFTFISNGFTTNPMDPCVLNATYDGAQVTVGIYVDDVILTSVSNRAIEWVLNLLTAAYGKLTVHQGTVHQFLGRIFDFSITGSCTITMPKHIDNLIHSTGVTGFSSYPANLDLFTIDPTSPLLAPAKAAVFRSNVALLRYIVDAVRPESHPAPSFLASRVQAPTEQDWNKLVKVVKYLNATKDKGIIIRPDKHFILLAYIDASFAIHSDSMRSHSGTVVQLGGSTVFTKSVKQKLNAKSSTEAELIAVSDGLPHVLWIREFLIGQGFNLPPTRVFQDNLSTMAMLTNGRATAPSTRYIAIRFFWAKDRVDSNEIVFEAISTEEMIADIMTKPLVGLAFHRLRLALLGWD